MKYVKIFCRAHYHCKGNFCWSNRFELHTTSKWEFEWLQRFKSRILPRWCPRRERRKAERMDPNNRDRGQRDIYLQWLSRQNWRICEKCPCRYSWLSHTWIPIVQWIQRVGSGIKRIHREVSPSSERSLPNLGTTLRYWRFWRQ